MLFNIIRIETYLLPKIKDIEHYERDIKQLQVTFDWLWIVPRYPSYRLYRFFGHTNVYFTY